MRFVDLYHGSQWTNWSYDVSYLRQLQQRDQVRTLNGQYRRGFLHQLCCQLALMPSSDQERLERLKCLLTDAAAIPEMCDVFEAEIMLVQSMPDERLDSYRNGLSYRYEAAHGDPMPEVPSSASSSQKRQHYLECLNEMYREIESRRAKENGLAEHLRNVSLVGFAVVLVLLAIAVLGDQLSGDVILIIPPFAFICVAGGLGAILGYVKDVLKPRGRTDLVLLTFEIEATRRYWLYRVLAGVLYALIFSLLAASGVFQSNWLKSELLPDLSNTLKGGTGMMKLFMERLPTTEYVKLVAWCFVAGYFQPFVPGVLDRLTARISHSEVQTPAKTSHVSADPPTP